MDLAKTVLEDFLAPNLTSRNNYAFAVQEQHRAAFARRYDS